MMGKEVDDAFDGMHDILTIVDMDVTQDLHPTLGGADDLRGKIVDTLTSQWVYDTSKDTHLLLDAADIEGMAGREKKVVFVECQKQAAVHVDELRSEDQALVKVGTINNLQHHIGIVRLHNLAVMHLNPVNFHPVSTTGDSLLQ